jgi:hypothetical protein
MLYLSLYIIIKERRERRRIAVKSIDMYMYIFSFSIIETAKMKQIHVAESVRSRKCARRLFFVFLYQSIK